MTAQELQAILAGEAKEAVSKLSVSSFASSVPAWSDLDKQYDPLKHKINDPIAYPPKKVEGDENDHFQRTCIGMQKLAVSLTAQALFATPVRRQYTYDRNSTSEVEAAKVLEELYKQHACIDSVNMERAKRLYKTCQVLTVWQSYELIGETYDVAGLETNRALKANIYSEDKGYKLYPIIDEYGDILAVSVGYTAPDGTEYLTTYTKGVPSYMYHYIRTKEGWALAPEFPRELEVFPCLYINTDEPAWGGEAGTNIVEQMEHHESFDGMYITDNAAPLYVCDPGKTEGRTYPSTEKFKSGDARRVLEVGEGGSVKGVAIEGAEQATSNRLSRLQDIFYTTNQLADMSFKSMTSAHTSAENKELVFAGVRAKAIDLGGEWVILFNRELNIIKKIAAVMFPTLAEAFKSVKILSIITPYNVNTRADTALYIEKAGGSMSLRTRVALLGEAGDVEQEAGEIEADESRQANAGI